MIGVNQNTLMMYLSILATVFIPPSLIVSIFSVQFEGMPSFHWTTGFLLLFLLMALSSFGAYKVLKNHQETPSS
jgi:magnesium transporter